LNEYFLKTGYLLYHYYDGNGIRRKIVDEQRERESEETIERAIEDDDDGSDSGSEMGMEDGFESQSDQDDIKLVSLHKRTSISSMLAGEVPETIQPVVNVEPRKKTKITDFMNKEDGFEKAEIYDKYIKLITNQTFIQKDIFQKKDGLGQRAICSQCNIPLSLIHSEGIQVCTQCGQTEYILIDSEKPSFRDPPPEVSYFAYKRINHFNEWLSQFQAKESTEIPSEIYEQILLEMKKERITDFNKLTVLKIREYLKKLKLNKYYEHIPHIINKLNNQKVPVISKEIEEKLRHMFREIQAPFMKVKNNRSKTRKNFLSYSYVLHKFVELLGLDYLKDCFPLLKSREKLHQQDQIWKDICKELNWMYIKSI
jgi:hypothetical protein